MTSSRQLADSLDAIIGMIRGLRPSWRDGEQFYEQRSEAIGRLNGLAASLRRSGVIEAPVRAIEVVRIVERTRVVSLPGRLRIRPRHTYPRPPRAGSSDLFEGTS
jgi:hypothetical protein